MSQPRDNRQDDLFRAPLEEIINLSHPLVRLAGEIDWDFLAGCFSSVCRVGPGQPPLPTRLVAGLFILKHMHNLSDEGVELRQSYLRLAKRAAIMVGRYTHAHQFKRARRELKFLRTRLGRIIRDIRRKIEGNTALEDRFGPLLDLALRVRHQEQRQRGPKVYSLHAPEVECIGRGKARAPYEFGCKVSIATPVTAPKGGQFVLHAKALHGNP